jgi:hypothetical protein
MQSYGCVLEFVKEKEKCDEGRDFCGETPEFKNSYKRQIRFIL